MMQWPADRVERMSVADLLPYARNTRKHSPAQVSQIAASMREWGFTIPVLIDENREIIAGHGRLLAAQKLGFESVPVMTAVGWTPQQIKAYRIADNQLALNAAWDNEMLALEFADLDDQMRELTGMAEAEIERLLATTKEGLTDPDEVPEVPETPTSALGDLWLLGKHRLICGDATSADVTTRLFDGIEPGLMVTDPPYGVDYDPMWRNRVKRRDGSLVGAKATGVVANDHQADWREAWALFPGDVAYVWHGGLRSLGAAEGLEAAGFTLRSQIIWAKSQFVIGRGDYHWQHEPCWYAVRKGGTGHWAGDRKQSTIWEINALSGYLQEKDGPDAHSIHSTQKPVECMRRPMLNNSSPGQAVYDPFMGSGTTIIAAEMASRQALGVELNPAYVDVAVKRWQAFAGAEARLAGTDETFDQIAARRSKAAA